MNKSFVTVTPDSGSNNGNLSVTVGSNMDEARNEIIFVVGGGLLKLLK